VGTGIIFSYGARNESKKKEPPGKGGSFTEAEEFSSAYGQ
jgi:hypothetical protein